MSAEEKRQEESLLAGERGRIADMILHRPSAWWTPTMIAEAIRRGERCHPECPECELEKEAP
jgi:hypothetical protein